MFGPEAPPLQWDSEGAYTRGRVQLFYLAHAAQPLSLEALSEVRPNDPKQFLPYPAHGIGPALDLCKAPACARRLDPSANQCSNAVGR